MAAPIKLFMLMAILTIFGIGIYDMVANVERNGCEMTYMYNNPEYLVSLATRDVLCEYKLTESSSIDFSGLSLNFVYELFIEIGRFFNFMLSAHPCNSFIGT